MKPFSKTLLATALCCGVAFAQPTSRTDEIFRRLGRSGDGRLTRDEVPPAAGRIFDRLDAEKDGVVTAGEAASFNVPSIARGGTTGPTGVPITPNRRTWHPAPLIHNFLLVPSVLGTEIRMPILCGAAPP